MGKRRPVQKNKKNVMIIKAVMFYFRFGSVIRLVGGYQRVIKSAGTVNSAEISIIYGTPHKH